MEEEDEGEKGGAVFSLKEEEVEDNVAEDGAGLKWCWSTTEETTELRAEAAKSPRSEEEDGQGEGGGGGSASAPPPARTGGRGERGGNSQ